MAGNLFSLRASVELGRDVAMSEACQCRDSRSRRSTNARHRADCIIDSGTRTVHAPSPGALLRAHWSCLFWRRCAQG